MKVELIQGDVARRLPLLEAASFDACLSDPPYGLSFMGKKWDHDVPGPEAWRLVLPLLKPGASLLAFGGTRKFHRLMSAIEDAGFTLRDTISWVYGQGFPKSLDVAQAIDKSKGAERPRDRKSGCNASESGLDGGGTAGSSYKRPWMEDPEHRFQSREPITKEAKRFEGYGTALKPAWEPIIVAMRPNDGSFAENAIKHGVSGLNVDASRIGTVEMGRTKSDGTILSLNKSMAAPNTGRVEVAPSKGRFPANFILQHATTCEYVGVKKVRSTSTGVRGGAPNGLIYGKGFPRGDMRKVGKADSDGMETVEDWLCSKWCPSRQLDEQSGNIKSSQPRKETFEANFKNTVFGHGMGGPANAGNTYEDEGGASRFFYCAKAGSEREAGNMHPTLKPTDLCRYLAKLILPPERETPRRLLVPFSGSGSEIIGALEAGWDEVVGIELQPEYVALAENRIHQAFPLFPRFVKVRRWRKAK